MTILRLVISLAVVFLCTPASAQPAPPSALQPAQLAIVINDADPDSVAVGAYYRKRRGIPAANVVHVSIPGKPHTLDPARFNLLKQEIDARLKPEVQAVLMIWTAPYAVGCNAITAAYTLGYDALPCSRTCAAAHPSSYFNAATRRPFSELNMRLSMLLPTESVAQAKALVDRGVSAGFRTLRWLDAGATASYGSVSEPCNYWQKFPNPSVLLKHYVNGNSAIEAYWKSVAWPAQGLFIGEPLATPYGTY